MIDARTATAQDFDAAAQRHANQFWVWAIIAAVVFIFLRWWAAIPAAFALYSIVESFSATNCAGALRKGTYRIPNPNNGAPDGNAAKR